MFRSHLRRSHRLLLTTTLVAVVALIAAGVAYATSAGISPDSQVGHSGVQVSWSATWSGTAPFNVDFFYGFQGANTPLPNTNSTSHTFHYTFYNCTDTVYYQDLQVTDHLGLNAGAESEVQVLKGDIC